jgi:single-stranded-DNA-specific exonuclease
VLNLGREEIKKFQRDAYETAAFLKSYLNGDCRIKIVTHTDADGLAGGVILAQCLYAYNVPFHVKFTRPLEPEEILELGKENYDLFVFIDQGTGQISSIQKFILEKERGALILDHHPGDLQKHPNLAYLNPHVCGLNGAKDVSASGVVYSVVENINKSFRSLIGLMMVGAIGDRQEFVSGFSGVNETLYKRAIDLGFLTSGEGLKLIGRSIFPVADCLSLSAKPYLPGISGNSPACKALVDELYIKKEDMINKLDREVEENLKQGILARLGPIAENEEFCRTLWGPTYTLSVKEIIAPTDARDYVAMLDACGKLRKPELGFTAAMGDQAAHAEAIASLLEYQGQMMGALRWLELHPDALKVTPRMRYVYAGDAIGPTMIGEALSLAIESGMITPDRPMFGLADINADKIKISARATPSLAIEGVNVGRTLSKVSDAVGGSGGGHDVSAAARIPRERMDEFLIKLEQALADGTVCVT